MLSYSTIIRIATVIGILLVILSARVLDPNRSDLAVPVFSSLLTVGVVFLAAAWVIRRSGKQKNDDVGQREERKFN